MVVRDGLVAGKHDHDRVAHELVDDAVVLDDHLGQRGEAAVQRVEDHARRVGLGDGGEAAQVGEQDRDFARGIGVAHRGNLARGDALHDVLQARPDHAGEAPAHGFGDEILDPPDRVLDDPALGHASFFLLLLTFL